jgi:hypothetical protein
LEREREALADDISALRVLENGAKEVLLTNVKDMRVAASQRDEWLRHEFLVEARRVKLISEMAAIYPIVENSRKEWTIRGLELPADPTTMVRQPTSPGPFAPSPHALTLSCIGR